MRFVVRRKGLEPSRLAVQTPEACASTNFATFASCDPDESRTHDHRLRKPILYPPELRDHRLFSLQNTELIITIIFYLARKISKIT